MDWGGPRRVIIEKKDQDLFMHGLVHEEFWEGERAVRLGKGDGEPLVPEGLDITKRGR